VSPATAKQMLTTQIGAWGLGFQLEDPGDGQVFSHGGSDEGFESFLFAYADGRGGAVVMTNGQRGGALAPGIAASPPSAYGWKYGASQPRAALKLTPERAAQFAGEYVANPPGQPAISWFITAEGDKLWGESPPQVPKQRLYIMSDTQAFFATSPILLFKSDDTGKPSAIRLNPNLWMERKK